MIAFLKGYIEEKTTDAILLDVQGVGYKVEVSAQTLGQVSKEGKEIKIHIYHHITENDQRLFGFYSVEEKKVFEKLITVKGVGPKLGLTILSGLPVQNLVQSIVQSNVAALSKTPGIGKKTAERIILELKEKLIDVRSSSAAQGEGTSAEGFGFMEEAVSALESLGFKTKESEQAVLRVMQDDPDVETPQIIKKALILLNR